jgi:hypothetical protein
MHGRHPEQARDPEELQRQPVQERRGAPAGDLQPGAISVKIGREQGDEESRQRERR